MRVSSGLLLVLMLVLAGGCAPAGRTELKRPDKIYRSIVSLSPSATEILVLYAGADRVQGRTESCNYPAPAEKIPIVTKGYKPDTEKLASMKPDLVVYDPMLYSESDIAKIKELGIEVFPYLTRSMAEFRDTLYRLGAKVRMEVSISEYLDKIEAARVAATTLRDERTAAGKPSPTVAVLMPGEGGEHMIAGLKSYWADLVRESGGEPVGPDADKFVPLDAEALVGLNPDVVLVAGDRASVAADPRLKSIKAFKNARVSGMKADIILRAGSRVDLLIGGISKYL